MAKISKKIRWLGYAGFLISEKPSIYIDPYKLAFPDIGELILVTNNHECHCSPDEIKWLRKGSTVIVTPENCANLFEGDIRGVIPGDKLNIKGAEIEVIPAYINDNPNHPKENGGVGYVITMKDGTRIYHTGDTEIIPEMYEGMADILLVPVHKDIMNAEQAAAVVNLIKPQFTIPMHWDKKVKTEVDEVNKFVELCESKIVVQKAKP
jgi:L-ascorbate metabolism protein UlaG (beta-lactamase superfamily)